MSLFGRKSSSGADQPISGGSSGDRDQELQTILSHLKDKIKGVPVQDRRYHFTTYPLCFVGREAVDWLVDNKYAKSRSDAVDLGQRLFKAGYIQHVTKDHPFKDEKLFYKFLAKVETDQSDKDKTPKKGTGSTSEAAAGEKRKKTSILAFFIGEEDDDPEPPAPLVPVPQPSASKQDRKEYMKTVAMRMQAKQLVLAPEENGKEFDPTATVHRRAAAQLLGENAAGAKTHKAKVSILDGGLFAGPSGEQSPTPSPTASPSSSLGPSAGAEALKSSGHSSGSAGSSPSGSLKVPSKKSVKIAEAVADARASNHRRNPSNDAEKESSKLGTTPDNGTVAGVSSTPKPTLRRQTSIAKDDPSSATAHQRSSSSGVTGAEITKGADDKDEKEKRRHHRSKSVQVTLPDNVSVMVAGTATPVKDNPARPRAKGDMQSLPSTLPAGVLPSLAQQEVEIQLLLLVLQLKFNLDNQKLIGRGATGKVYKAVVNKELRAMKVLSMVGLDPKKQKKVRLDLKTEVDIIGSLPHTNIVQYYGLFYNKEAQELSLLMEFVDGLSVTKLAEYQRFHHTDKKDKNAKIILAPPMTAQIVLQILQALVYLKDHRVIHRDLKPDNLLVDKAGVVKLIDFGMSAQLASTQTHRNSAVGTPWYVAPEVIMGENYAFEADIWSVGCTVLELVTGRPPFSELNAVNALSTMAEEDPEIPETLEVNCKAFIKRCIVRKTKDRATAPELIAHAFMKSAASPTELSKLVNLSMLYATPEP